MERRFPLKDARVKDRGILNLLGSDDGLYCPIQELRLAIRTQDRTFLALTFRFDSGCSMMVIPVNMAEVLRIPYRREAKLRGTSATHGGNVPCYYDYVHIKCALTRREYQWPCVFSETDKDYMLVGRANFLQEFAVAIVDNDFIIVPREDAGPLKRFAKWLFGWRQRVQDRWTVWDAL